MIVLTEIHPCQCCLYLKGASCMWKSSQRCAYAFNEQLNNLIPAIICFVRNHIISSTSTCVKLPLKTTHPLDLIWEEIEMRKNFNFGNPSWKNKPYFCLGSCKEIHAKSKSQNKTSLKHSWNILENLFRNFLETQLTLFKHPWNFLKMSLRLPWNTL